MEPWLKMVQHIFLNCFDKVSHIMPFMIYMIVKKNFGNPFAPWNPLCGSQCRPLNSNVSKTVTVNIVSTGTFLKEHSISFLIISRLIDSLHLWFSSYWCLKSVELFESRKTSFSIFPAIKGLSKIKKIKHHSKHHKLVWILLESLLNTLSKKFLWRQCLLSSFSRYYCSKVGIRTRTVGFRERKGYQGFF